MKRILKKIGWIAGIMAILCVAIMLICNQLVVNNARGKVVSDIDSIKYNKVGLLLGTTPQARFDRITNYFFIYRIDAAEQLYKAGKIEKILISGDENSLDGVNEPECMRDSLVARGVPANAIILDGKGYRTICSVINANKVFGLKSFTIISQKFHNERAIYQAEHLGLDVENIQAYNAKDPKSRRAYLTTIREYFARVKMFLDLLTYKETDYYNSKEPKNDLSLPQDTIHSFLGKPIILNDSICEQIAAIAEQDKMLSYGDSILQIGDVRWRVNINKTRFKGIPSQGVTLITSVQPDDPKMKLVVQYLDRIYGKSYGEEEDSMRIIWSSSDNKYEAGCTLVRLRRVRLEEGGTILRFSTFHYFLR